MSKLRTGSGVYAAFLLVTPAMVGGSDPAFEVASVRPSTPFTMARMGSPDLAPTLTIDQARVTIRKWSLLGLVAYAWHLKNYQVAGPAWMLTANFDIAAKIAENSSPSAVPEMLRTLLVERFCLRAHEDSGLLPVYALVVGKDGPKLTRKPADHDPSPRGNLSPMTMERLAECLSDAADRPVVDDTRLEGEYLVPMLEVTKLMLFEYIARHHPRPGSDAPAPNAEDTDIFLLVRRCGLRLEPRKLSLRRLTIDHIESTAGEN